MGRRVLILGGGFGGVSAAHHLRQLLGPDDEIVLVDRRTHFMMGFRKNTAVAGREPMDAGRRPLAALSSRGVRVVQQPIERIEPAARAVIAGDVRIEGDALVVALGADVVPDAVPGLREHALNTYSADDVPRAAEALTGMNEGRVVIGIFGAPYKCPPAPYELAILAQDAARARGSTARFSVFTPQPLSLPVLGAAGCQVIDQRLLALGIEFRPNSKAERVEAGRVLLAGGDAIPFDLLLAVPPHRCPGVIVAAGLAEPGGWVKVNRRTLETTVEGVWAAGDCTVVPMANGQPMPKAGVFAESEGRVIAHRIAAFLAGGTTDAEFDGVGQCYLEVGGGEAMAVRGSFLTDPPQVALSDASPEVLAEKAAFERGHLDTWFGPAA